MIESPDPTEHAPELRPESVNLAKYVRILDALRAAILGGQYPPGTRLPGRKVLARVFHCAPMTVGQAFTELEKAGAVHTRQGSGTYVTDRAVEVLAGTPDPVTFDEQLDGMRAVISSLTRSVDALVQEVRELRAAFTERVGCLVPEQRDHP